MIRFLIAFFLFLVTPLFVGCVAISEDYQEPAEPAPVTLDVIYIQGDVESCMFTVWWFTKPQSPPIADVHDKCVEISGSMGLPAYEQVLGEILKEVEKGEVTEARCQATDGSCL